MGIRFCGAPGASFGFRCSRIELVTLCPPYMLSCALLSTASEVCAFAVSWSIFWVLELSCFFHDPADVGHLISGSSAFSQTSLNIRKFTVHVLLKPGLENFECTVRKDQRVPHTARRGA